MTFFVSDGTNMEQQPKSLHLSPLWEGVQVLRIPYAQHAKSCRKARDDAERKREVAKELEQLRGARITQLRVRLGVVIDSIMFYKLTVINCILHIISGMERLRMTSKKRDILPTVIGKLMTLLGHVCLM